jgi:hypothetical protein
MYMEKIVDPPDIVTPFPNAPSIDLVLDTFIRALGGADRLARLTSSSPPARAPDMAPNPSRARSRCSPARRVSGPPLLIRSTATARRHTTAGIVRRGHARLGTRLRLLVTVTAGFERLYGFVGPAAATRRTVNQI